MRAWASGLWGLAALLAAFLLLTKPVHIDDTVVLHVAAQVLKNPLRPFDGEFFWLAEPRSLFETTTNPPLVSYWLAPAIALGGYREWWLHLWLMPFAGLLGWGVYRLAWRWLGESYAGWAAAWVLLSPAVLPGMNLMRDVPALGLFVAGLACWVEGIHRAHRGWLFWGALLGGLAGLAKYTALSWVGVALAYAVFQGAWRQVWWLAVALVPITLWSGHNFWVYGEPHLLYLWQERRGSAPWEAKWLPAVVGLGASTLIGLAVLWSRRLPLWQTGLLVLGVVGLAYWHRAFYASEPFHWQAMVWLALGATQLGLALLSPAPSQGSDATGWFLRLWLGIGLAGAVWGVPFQAMRHLLFALVPMVLLLMRGAPLGRLHRTILGVQAVLSLLILWGDYQYAQVYRDFAARARAMWGHERVWYAGSWGWMFYAERAGFRKILPSGEGLEPGDLILVPELAYKGRLPADFETSAHYAGTLVSYYPLGAAVYTMNAEAGGYYYALVRGRAPFAFGYGLPLEVFRVYRWVPPE
ncbi:MAG: glycosyltransferase family 39 protein [Fimbriimonadales bacterium]|jgi:hypothetical protein|nr:glycosyltransferase family 39 protein [Fimbriimonadales bacterium]GIV13903.1 MAG: hypothetical protein KatS3mg021_2185 [Fimbriimonadales bacterium]CUU00553.1 Dolichyl-phosphate-mannose-protein mannosyltransferase [Armatimonadetes bacterium GBS]CUU34869.1 Dolichyl-phosphate-mannose-protein mannosyltransferase [Armatimonadetes bacterium GXS]